VSRPYTQKKRAEQVSETRRRIVEAAVELHGKVGPAATTFSMIADRAGVQRHTLYAHFPDERSLLLACSGMTLERDPLPDATPWGAIEDPRERLRRGLSELYAWYARNAELVACVLRDAERHAPTREIAGLRFGPPMAACRGVLGAALTPRQHALLALALDFHAWRTLADQARLSPGAAAEVLVEAIVPSSSSRPAGHRRAGHRERRRKIAAKRR
jgi:AcrR family transcriptional regulator